jgi:uncharacterized protein YjbI with pentapeptide repeats
LRITQIDFSGANFDKANFDYAELGDSNFSLCSMKGATFRFARINDCNFDEANMEDAVFYGATFDDNSFKKAILRDADFRFAGRGEFFMTGNLHFHDADLSGADFSMSRLSWADRQLEIDKYSAKHSTANVLFHRANLTKANFSEAWMEALELNGANLTGADFSNGKFASSKSTFDTIWGGADFTNSDMSKGSIGRLDVVKNTTGKTDFHTLKLKGSNWRGFSWFGGVHLGPVDFSGCYFTQASWEDPANLKPGYAGTDFFGVSMAGAKFVGADLRFCGFGNANVNGVDFTDADCTDSEWSLGNSVRSAYPENLGDLEQRYNNINFDDTKLHGVNFASGNFAGSNFKSAKFDNESALNPHTTTNGPTVLKC